MERDVEFIRNAEKIEVQETDQSEKLREERYSYYLKDLCCHCRKTMIWICGWAKSMKKMKDTRFYPAAFDILFDTINELYYDSFHILFGNNSRELPLRASLGN